MRIRFIQEFIDAFRGKRQKVHGVKYFLKIRPRIPFYTRETGFLRKENYVKDKEYNLDFHCAFHSRIVLAYSNR